MAPSDTQALFRSIPAVDSLLEHPSIAKTLEQFPQSLIVSVLRSTLDEVRAHIQGGETGALVKEGAVSTEDVVALALSNLERLLSPSLRKVINATGVVLHTNLGRAPLNGDLMGDVSDVVSGYSNLEYDISEKGRGSRHVHVETLLRELLGVEAALVVNNCAAAVLLILAGIARKKEVIVSRGELVEIGGSFRVPDVMEVSGATLREVGTTNRTRLEDYENAITDQTGLLMKAYRSNFAMVGFTEEVDCAQLAALGQKHNIPTAMDLGSGLVIDLKPYGIHEATTVQETVASGIDLVCFSGDKLLGGPQAGIITGKKEWVDRLKKNPLTRALRVDKLTISGLERTLLAYLDGSWKKRVPALDMITTPPEILRTRAESLEKAIHASCGAESPLQTQIVDTIGKVGGGTLPLSELQGFGVALSHSQFTADQLESRLRTNKTPVITRIEDEKVLLDVRTISDEEALEVPQILANSI